MTTPRTYTGAVYHLSSTGKPGGSPSCKTSRARMTSNWEAFSKSKVEERCLKCEEIRKRLDQSNPIKRIPLQQQMLNLLSPEVQAKVLAEVNKERVK